MNERNHGTIVKQRAAMCAYRDGRPLSVQAPLMGMDRKTLGHAISEGRYKYKKSSGVTLGNAIAMARFWGVSLDWLCGLED